MSAALKAELLKLRTTKTARGLAAAMVGLVLLAVTLHSLGLSLHDLRDRAGQSRVLVEAGENMGAVFAALLGAMSITGEIRHGTIRPTLLGIPRRGRVIAAKAATSAAGGILIGLLATSVAAVAGTAAISARGVAIHLDAWDYFRLIGGGAVAAALLAGIGLGLGAVVRNQVAAVAAIFVWLLFVENVLIDSVPSVSRYMPGALARGVAVRQTGTLHSPVLALVLLVVYTAAVATIGWRTTLRRDFA